MALFIWTLLFIKLSTAKVKYLQQMKCKIILPLSHLQRIYFIPLWFITVSHLRPDHNGRTKSFGSELKVIFCRNIHSCNELYDNDKVVVIKLFIDNMVVVVTVKHMLCMCVYTTIKEKYGKSVLFLNYKYTTVLPLPYIY